MDEAILNNLVRVGTVRAVDPAKRKARVWYDDLGIISGWLTILQLYGAGVNVVAGGGHSHQHEVSSQAGHVHAVTDNAIEHHEHHGTTVGYFMPKVDARVLVLYLPVFNGDGFILGGL